MIISFRDFIVEATKPDGIAFLDHRNVWVVYQNGRIMVTKKTEAQAKAWLAKKSGAVAPKAVEAPAKAPEVKKPTAVAPKAAAPNPIDTTNIDKKLDDKEAKADYEKRAKERWQAMHSDDNMDEDGFPIDRNKGQIRSEFDIPEHNITFFQEKLEKLNKKAAKLGLPPIKVAYDGTWRKEIPSGNDDSMWEKPKRYMTLYKIRLEGEAPVLAGWSFMGKREPLENTKSVLVKGVKSSDDNHVQIPDEYHDDHDLKCDHCNKRANRKETFIVHDGKKFMEVGRSCLKDFLGHKSPQAIADFAEVLWDIEKAFADESDRDGHGGRVIPSFDMKEVMATAIASIRSNGFVSNQYANERNMSTSHRLNNHFDPPLPPPGFNQNKTDWYSQFKIPADDNDKKDAERVIEWLKNHPDANKQDFFRNLSKIAAAESTGLKNTGYIAAGVSQFMKAEGTAKARESLKSTIKNEGLGKEGDKVKVKGTVISLFRYDTDWGTKSVLTIKTETGHLVKMFTMSGDDGVKKDAKVEISGKIGKVEAETYDKSPFKGTMMTTMAPRSRVESYLDPEDTDKAYHVGDRIKFTGEDGRGKIGEITAKPVFGRFEVKPIATTDTGMRIMVNHDKILGRL